MPRFNLKNSNLFPLPKNPHMLHLGTIEYGMREFVVMHCTRGPAKGNTYIEEAVLTTVDWTKDVFANFKFIADDNLAQDLAAYADEKGLTDIKRRFHEASDRGMIHIWKGGK